MNDRVSQTIVLCEDDAHYRLTKAYLKRCGLPSDPPLVKWLVASWEGGNDVWVLNRFATELHACRQRNKKTKTRLVTLLDADNHSVDERRRQLLERVKSVGLDAVTKEEPVVILVPKRHVETWIRALLGEAVTEAEDCKSWKPTDKDTFRKVGETLYDWSRPNASPGATCVQSLRLSLPQWNRIG